MYIFLLFFIFYFKICIPYKILQLFGLWITCHTYFKDTYSFYNVLHSAKLITIYLYCTFILHIVFPRTNNSPQISTLCTTYLSSIFVLLQRQSRARCTVFRLDIIGTLQRALPFLHVSRITRFTARASPST